MGGLSSVSGEHKRPLVAFVVVAVACMVTVVNAARSSAVEALPGWTPVAEAAATHPPGPDPFAADPRPAQHARGR